ncbi:hypothetical protein AJ80_02848 [Polytolypa hystricis UAMH7299]|uniref:Uncharacterized protein n=1 Tax=Polytolypa hystricis (strain UAMH7299) TaxID=1447883 RepID=A0A2B7YG66_POLH7|nr:hypothetical protein AJ80_02848 [Polytolypa hystricis UAMH7299]
MVAIRSAPPSETTPTKPIPDRTAAPPYLEAPEWKNNGDAINWLVQLRERVKDAVYRYSSILQNAIGLFEETQNTNYRNYNELKRDLEELWRGWRIFAATTDITTGFLLSSFLYNDLRSPVSCIRTPKNAPRRIAVRMNELRNSAREIVSGIATLCTLVDEAAMRLEGNRDGFEIEAFPELPNVEGSSESGHRATETEERLQPEEYDSDEEAAEEKAERERIELDALRNLEDMDLRAFDPVWMRGEEFPGGGEVTEEIKDMIGERAIKQMTGPIWSIFWLAGYDDLVEVIDDPAYVLEGEMTIIPPGCSAGPFLLDRSVAVADLCLGARPQNLPMTVETLSLKHRKKIDVFWKQAKALLGDDIMDNSNMSFRGLSLTALEQTLAFFMPSKEYAGTNGAIMVFKNPDYCGLEVWRPQGEEWKDLLAAWRRLPLKDIRLSDRYKNADVIIGPMSAAQAKGANNTMLREPDNDIIQQAYVRYRSCECLAASLVAIIYVKNSGKDLLPGRIDYMGWPF